MSTDPVSTEMQAIKMMRIQGQGQYTTPTMPNYLKASGGVIVQDTVPGAPPWAPNPSEADPKTFDNIGEIDEADMTILHIINGTVVGVKDRPLTQLNSGGAYIVASPLKGHNSTFIEFALPESHAGKSASIEIYDLKGKLVTRLSHKVSGVLNHLSWNETSAAGSHVGTGVYIVRLVSGGLDVSSKFSIAR
jgi:hypothetical protein